MLSGFYRRLAEALGEREVDAKLAAVDALLADWRAGTLAIENKPGPAASACGRPDRPRLVGPHELPRRSAGSKEGRAALLHAIAHIEFSAINLALDHAFRFRGLPRAYYDDWVTVAGEEALHFRMLREHLRTLGHDYGDFPAHDGLWQMAEKTAGDPLARMALVPRLLEARGLDATPPIQAKLEKAGDIRAARLLDVILRDEIGHVAIGDRWFRHFCAERAVEPEATYRKLIADYGAPRPQAPMNVEARRIAGFSAEELVQLGSQDG